MMEIVLLIGFIIALYIVLNVLKNYLKKELVCTRCHTVALPETKTKGSFLIEVILWLCFIVPGLIYSIWRLSSKFDVCPSCGSTDLVSADSPRGQSILKNSDNHADKPDDVRVRTDNDLAWKIGTGIIIIVCIGVIWFAITANG